MLIRKYTCDDFDQIQKLVLLIVILLDVLYNDTKANPHESLNGKNTIQKREVAIALCPPLVRKGFCKKSSGPGFT